MFHLRPPRGFRSKYGRTSLQYAKRHSLCHNDIDHAVISYEAKKNAKQTDTHIAPVHSPSSTSLFTIFPFLRSEPRPVSIPLYHNFHRLSSPAKRASKSSIYFFKINSCSPFCFACSQNIRSSVGGGAFDATFFMERIFSYCRILRCFFLIGRDVVGDVPYRFRFQSGTTASCDRDQPLASSLVRI